MLMNDRLGIWDLLSLKRFVRVEYVAQNVNSARVIVATAQFVNASHASPDNFFSNRLDLNFHFFLGSISYYLLCIQLFLVY